MGDTQQRKRSVGMRILSHALRTLIAVVGAAAVIGGMVAGLIGHHSTPHHPKPTPSVTYTPFVIDNPALSDEEIEGYWYCWNSGDPQPHHLDHWVPNDHLCTWGELRNAEVTR
ncbi:hypothetical protein [Streptomyces sp. NPDC006446]|uniref:hypothetical protein n=1 Tax=Streptomyces sp. NPDC006446 TaxID=3154301 RepID=UPI0033AACB82